MKLTIWVPTPNGLEPVHVEHHNEGSRDIPSLHLRAVLAHEVDEEEMITREVLTVDASGASQSVDTVLRVELPYFDTTLARHFLSGLGIHGAGSWIEERLNERGSVVYHATGYTLRLQAFGDEAGLLAAAGWPLEMGIGGSMLLPMRLLALQAYGEGLRAEMRNAFRAPEVREVGRYGQDVAPVDTPTSGVLVDPGPRDYSGDRGPAPTWEDEVGAEFAKLRELEDRRDHVVWVAGSSVASAHAVDLGDSGEVRGFLDAPDVDVVVVDSTLLTPDEEASEMRAASDRDPREDI